MLEVIASRFREAGLTAADAELFAKSTLRDLDAQGVVKKVKKKIHCGHAQMTAMRYSTTATCPLLEAGYEAIEPLI